MSAMSPTFRLNAVLAFFLVLFHIPALAGISYNLEQSHAGPGETIRV